MENTKAAPRKSGFCVSKAMVWLEIAIDVS